MAKTQFTKRHVKLIELKDNIDLLMLGERNQEARKHLAQIRQKAVIELRKEQAKIGLIKSQSNENVE